MGDHDELRVAAELPEQEREPVDVGVVERSVHLVEDAEGAGLHEVDGEEQRDRGEGLLAAGEEGERLRLLPPRTGEDVDLRLQRIVAAQRERRLPPFEQGAEHLLEILVHLGEGLLEELRGGHVDLLDRLEQGESRLVEILALAFEEAKPLAALLVILHREEVHGPEGAEFLLHLLQAQAPLLARARSGAFRRFDGARHQRFVRHLALFLLEIRILDLAERDRRLHRGRRRGPGLEVRLVFVPHALHEDAHLRFGLGPLQLRAMEPLGQLVVLASQLPRLGLQIVGGTLHGTEALPRPL